MARNKMMKKRFFLSPLSLRARFHIGIGAFLIIVCFVSAFLIYRHEKSLLEEIAHARTDLVMAAVEASRAYIREELRPKMYAEFGHDFFMLEAMSTSYAGRAFMDIFSRKVPNFNYRRVSVNARNPHSEANDLEKEMMAVDDSESYRGTARYTEMDGGNIGFLCGGGGGSLLAYDALLRYGGQPANYTEFGGNPPENKVMGLVKGVLSKAGVKSFFMATNITNNTQTDVVAKGVIRAFQEKNIDPAVFPTVVRLPGVNDAEARRLFNEFGIEYYGSEISIEDAARIIVEKMN